MQNNVDFAIVGGGLSGCTMALALAKECPDASIALLDKAAVHSGNSPTQDSTTDTGPKPPRDIRATALTYTSANYLAYLSVWEGLETRSAIEHIHVSQRGGFGVAKLSAAEQNLEALGYVVANDELLAVLEQRLSTLNQVQRVSAEVSSIEGEAEKRLVLSNGDSLNARCFVVADGGHSPVAESLGLVRQQQDFQQLALVANVAVAPHKQDLQATTAWERFTSQGPIALLPLGKADGRLWFNLVWCQKAADYSAIRERLLATDDKQLLSQLQQLFGERVGQLAELAHKQVFPIRYQALQQVVANNCVFIGNAAQTLHPVAGQGFNLGLRDIATLAEVFALGAAYDSDIDLTSALSQYQTKREADRRLSSQFTNGIVQLFSNNLSVLGLGRGLGLGLIGANKGLRQTVAKHNMGHRGYIPAAMLGGQL